MYAYRGLVVGLSAGGGLLVIAVRALAFGASLVYLPPYCPDFNPIELLFSKFKWLLRSIADRTVGALWQTCGKLLDEFSESECRNYFRHCGYATTNGLL